METGINVVQKPWNWFEIWYNAFLRPTIKTYSRISSDPRSNVKWGLIWAAVMALVNWVVGPQRYVIAGYVAQMFGGQEIIYYVYVFGAFIIIILGVPCLALAVAILHGLARLFNGEGTFQRLLFSWAVMQLPFLLLIGLVIHIPFLPSLREDVHSMTGWLLASVKLFITLCIYLYLFYAQVVAFSAVEKFGVGEGFGILLLAALVMGVIWTCLSVGFQVAATNFFQVSPGERW